MYRTTDPHLATQKGTTFTKLIWLSYYSNTLLLSILWSVFLAVCSKQNTISKRPLIVMLTRFDLYSVLQMKKVRAHSSQYRRVTKHANKSASASMTTIDREASGIRRRRVRCKSCEPCTRKDCRECGYCNDMRKYGGLGKMKQSCIARQCLRVSIIDYI